MPKLKPSLFLNPLLLTAAAGIGTYGILKGKGITEEAKIKNKSSEYKKSVSKNLRNGNLSLENISPGDYEAIRDMYKTSSLNKIAFVSTAFNILNAVDIAASAKREMKSGKDSVKRGIVGTGQYKLNRFKPAIGINNEYK